ncbi:MAG: helix-turn-helix domain-containing protein [Patescibacteria group bacterium]
MINYQPTQVLSNQLSPYIKYTKSVSKGKLSQCIECFWELSAQATLTKATTLSILPDGCADIVFDLSNKHKAKALISGTMAKVSVIKLKPGANFFGIRFWPGKLFTLLNAPMKMFVKQDISLECMLPDTKAFISQVAAAHIFHERINIAETYITARLGSCASEDQQLQAILKNIFMQQGHVAITALAKQQNITERQFRRLFERYIGLSPKTFARTIRFQYLLQELLKTKKTSSIWQALQHGYYDQAHLINDLRLICNLSPQQFTHFISI